MTECYVYEEYATGSVIHPIISNNNGSFYKIYARYPGGLCEHCGSDLSFATIARYKPTRNKRVRTSYADYCYTCIRAYFRAS